MKLVTSEQMRQIDSAAIKGENIPSPQLMEQAGGGIARAILSELLLDNDDASFAIFCGKGNNGGDGFVVGRYLHTAGFDVIFYYLGPVDKLSPDAKLNYDRAKELDLELIEVSSLDQLPELLETDYIIDAIFGTGFSGAPRELSADLIDYINSQPQPVIAIDMPSGLNADTGKHEGEVVTAEFTFTLAQPKYGLYLSPGREKSGEVDIIDIGIPQKAVDRFSLHNELITPEFVVNCLPDRQADGHKGTFGKLFILGGSYGLSGAAALTATSALRAGCGLAKVGCPSSVLPIIASSVIEATTHPLPEVNKRGKLALRGLGEVRKLIEEHDAVAIGPGIGQHHETKELICRLLLGLEKPAVVDADGINALAGDLQILQDTPAELILTPHPGEFKRMTGITPEEDIHARMETARKFAVEYQTILVLKGSPALVAHYDGTVWLNPTGNNGMATGGSGDVLTGIIGSFLAQGMEPIEAALCGVYIHGQAGDFAADELGVRSMIASDIIKFFPDTFSFISF